MSLVVCVYVPEGIVIAGDSRITASRTRTIQTPTGPIQQQDRFVVSDSAEKVVLLEKVGVGVGAFGDGMVKGQPASSRIPKFEETKLNETETVPQVAEALHKYFLKEFPQSNVGFLLGGYVKEDGESIPYVYAISTGGGKRKPVRERRNITPDGTLLFGVLRAGEREIVNRLIKRETLPPFQAFPVQDAIDYATALVRITIEMMRFEPGVPTVGGAIDVLVIQPDRQCFVRKKELHG